jgi:hypothetical protein
MVGLAFCLAMSSLVFVGVEIEKWLDAAGGCTWPRVDGGGGMRHYSG